MWKAFHLLIERYVCYYMLILKTSRETVMEDAELQSNIYFSALSSNNQYDSNVFRFYSKYCL